jgi:hypothetical protein
MPKLLTKSKYLNGLQCPKLLWISVNDKKRIPEPDISAQAKFDTGNMVGELATKVFPNGIDLSQLGFKENIDATKDSLKLRRPIYEGGFLVDYLFSRADILLPAGEDEWDIIEVKSATKVKKLNYSDLAFQKYVYEKAGIKIRNCILMHLNNEFVKHGKIELKDLFVQTDVTKKSLKLSEEVIENIKKFKKIINGDEPEFNIDDVVTSEYSNICTDEFYSGLPKENIFELYYFYTRDCVELYKEGIVKIKDVPENVKLSDKQKIQRRLAHEGGRHIDRIAIKNFLGNLKYPLYYLDFETLSTAIPIFEDMKPYTQVPFQFSLHVQKEKGGECEHIEFLSEDSKDPREKFMQALKDNLSDKGDIIVWNESFENSRMKECALVLPKFQKWLDENILPRVKDLMIPFRDFDFYDPKQKGSASLKQVLGLFSDLSYEGLTISGDIAGVEFMRVMFNDEDEDLEEGLVRVSAKEREEVRKELLKYCRLDTLAEVEVLDGLWEELKRFEDER